MVCVCVCSRARLLTHELLALKRHMCRLRRRHPRGWAPCSQPHVVSETRTTYHLSGLDLTTLLLAFASCGFFVILLDNWKTRSDALWELLRLGRLTLYGGRLTLHTGRHTLQWGRFTLHAGRLIMYADKVTWLLRSLVFPIQGHLGNPLAQAQHTLTVIQFLYHSQAMLLVHSIG